MKPVFYTKAIISYFYTNNTEYVATKRYLLCLLETNIKSLINIITYFLSKDTRLNGHLYSYDT